MIVVTLWVCVLFYSVQGDPPACGWIQRGYRSRSRDLLELLKKMGGEETQDTVAVPFPYTLYRKVLRGPMEKRTTFLYEATRNIVHLFRRNLDGVTWNRTETDHFLDVLGQQMKELQTCASLQPRCSPEDENRLRNYFEELRTKVLHAKNYNLQSWELIRKVVRKHLEILELLWASIKNHKSK